jgi:bifunctional oligoribonuclease and PAP phosphatase NrnA
MDKDLSAVSEQIQRGDNFCVVSHVNPDGDSIGSLAAMSELLAGLNKQHVIFLHDKVPDKYLFLLEGLPVTRDMADVRTGPLLALDCSDLSRLGQLQEREKDYFIINIDHHVSNTRYGQINLVDPLAAATGEIIYRLALLLKARITKKMARALYTSISTDTGSFKYENTTGQTFQVMADLMQTGFHLREVSLRVFDETSLSSICLLREGLKSLWVSPDGKIACLTIQDEILTACDAREEDLEGLINHAVNIRGVEVGLLFRQKEAGEIKVGFRSKGVDVSRVAASLGGGGHAKAAGCSLDGDLEEARKLVLDRVYAELAG